MTKLGVALIALLSSSSALATEWYHLSSVPTGEVYVDEDSIVETDEDSLSLWIVQYYGPWNLTIRMSRTHYEVDCEDQTFRTLHYSETNLDGSGSSDSEIGDWRPMQPGTLSGRIRDYACELGDIVSSEIIDPEGDAVERFGSRS